MTGQYEPNEDECDWPSDSEDEDEEEGEKTTPAVTAEPDTPTKGWVQLIFRV